MEVNGQFPVPVFYFFLLWAKDSLLPIGLFCWTEGFIASFEPTDSGHETGQSVEIIFEGTPHLERTVLQEKRKLFVQ
jgi:hypothetical protein